MYKIDPTMMDRLFKGGFDPHKFYSDAALWDAVWSKVNKTETCWFWLGSRNNTGHGRIRVQYKKYLVTRIVYMMTEGPLTEMDFLCHKCNNPPCIRIHTDHVYKGTGSSNAQDREDTYKRLGIVVDRTQY